MRKNIMLSFVVMLILFVLSACSENAANSEKNSKNQADKRTKEVQGYQEKEVEYYKLKNPARELTEMEKKLLRKPGEFSGDNYDVQKVHERLDLLPADLTAQQYFDEMLYLLAEDFHKEVETFVNFDSSVNVDIARPDESVHTPNLKQTHYAILIDASGSMKANVNGKAKMETAKDAVQDFAKNIPDNATISLRIYGHKGSGSDADKKLSCGSTENVYNGNYAEQEFNNALDSIKPSGWTPIALALDQVKNYIPKGADDVVVYVVSDGIETCDGNPVESAKKLIDSNIKTVVNIIGFDVDNEGQKLLKEVADAGNGEFTYVNSEQQFKDYMRKQYEEIQQQWLEWKEAGKEQAIDIEEQKQKLADDMEESVTEKNDRQEERLVEAHKYLEAKYKEDYDHPIPDTWFIIMDYSYDVWFYGVNAGYEAWSESGKNGYEEWSNIAEEGNEKISETIDKKNSQ